MDKKPVEITVKSYLTYPAVCLSVSFQQKTGVVPDDQPLKVWGSHVCVKFLREKQCQYYNFHFKLPTFTSMFDYSH